MLSVLEKRFSDHLIGHNQFMLVQTTPAHPHFTVVCHRVQLLVQLYTEELDAIIRPRKFDHRMYADDIQLNQSCLLLKFLSFDHTLLCVTGVSHWIPSKNELIWFGSTSNLKKWPDFSTNIHLNTRENVPSSTVRDLGVNLDSSLDMHVQM